MPSAELSVELSDDVAGPAGRVQAHASAGGGLTVNVALLFYGKFIDSRQAYFLYIGRMYMRRGV